MLVGAFEFEMVLPELEFQKFMLTGIYINQPPMKEGIL